MDTPMEIARENYFNRHGYFLEDLEEANKLWESLEDVGIDENECIDADWHIFKKGTSRYDIWHWFEETFNVSVANDLM